jgi:hypothetical protein
MIRTNLIRLVTVLLLAGTAGVGAQAPKKPGPDVVEAKVWLTPTCGCCGKWVDHMQAASFKMTREVTTDMSAVPAHQRVPEALRSCHTAMVGQYIIEGHVPADLVRRLLKAQPKIVGLAAPGMPAGSPGMDVPNSPPFQVLAFDKEGHTRVFATHPSR